MMYDSYAIVSKLRDKQIKAFVQHSFCKTHPDMKGNI